MRWIALVFLVGCGDQDLCAEGFGRAGDGFCYPIETGVTVGSPDEDDDGDGFTENQGDCDDSAAEINPDAEDIPDDGIDSDCTGTDRCFADLDNDGFRSFADATVDDDGDNSCTGYGEAQASDPIGDCDDDPDACGAYCFPNNPAADVCDGYDNDCRGDVDEDAPTWFLDDDQDGWSADLTGQQQCLSPGANWSHAVSPQVDCDDGAPLVYPGAIDTWYDGIDSDCAGNDDYDQDRDGYIAQGYADVYTGALPDGDCADDDSLIHPAAMELLYDNVDQDCNGDSDSARFTFADATWVSPRAPRVGWTGEHYVMAVAAEQWTDYSGGNANQTTSWPGVLFRFPPNADNRSRIQENQLWSGFVGQQDPLGDTIDMVTDPTNGRAYIASSSLRSVLTGDQSYLALRSYEWNGSRYVEQNFILQSLQSDTLPTDVDVQIADSGSVFAAGCAADQLQYILGDRSRGTFQRKSVGGTTAAGGSTCVLDLDSTSDADAILMVQGPITADPKPYLLKDADRNLFVDQDPTGALVDPFDGTTLGLVNRDGDITSAYNTVDNTTTVTGPGVNEIAFTDLVVHDISSVMSPSGDLFILAVTEDRGSDGLNDLVLRFGPPGGPFTETEIAVDDGRGTLEPSGASIHVDGKRVFLAVAMRDTDTLAPADDLGWMFMGFAP